MSKDVNPQAIGSLEVDMSEDALKLLEGIEHILYDVPCNLWNKELSELMIDMDEDSWNLLRAICLHFRRIM